VWLILIRVKALSNFGSGTLPGLILATNLNQVHEDEH
jgi:hypothetical protein